jgi:hypothetical protein
MLPPIKLFATGVTAVGILLVASGSGAYWERQQAPRWGKVEAVVVSSPVSSWKKIGKLIAAVTSRASP